MFRLGAGCTNRFQAAFDDARCGLKGSLKSIWRDALFAICTL